MVESVEHRRAELSGGPLVDFEILGYPKVRNVRVEVPQSVPSHVAEGRTEYSLRFPAIRNEPNLLVRHRRCSGTLGLVQDVITH